VLVLIGCVVLFLSVAATCTSSRDDWRGFYPRACERKAVGGLAMYALVKLLLETYECVSYLLLVVVVGTEDYR